MVKQIIPAIAFVILLGSCSSLKTLTFTGKPRVAPVTSQHTAKVSETKFIEEIAVTPQPLVSVTEVRTGNKETFATRGITIEQTPVKNEQQTIADLLAYRSANVEKASPLQLKYAVLLNTEVELLANTLLLRGVDEWYGTRYRMGGTTKNGVDCSAFVGAVYATVYSLTLPRTARDQYKSSRRISITELQEGDLLFFNTIGGISHVGIYLQNNKFIHATSSKGVMVSDLFEKYYLQRYIGAGRIDNKQASAVISASVSGGGR